MNLATLIRVLIDNTTLPFCCDPFSVPSIYIQCLVASSKSIAKTSVHRRSWKSVHPQED